MQKDGTEFLSKHNVANNDNDDTSSSNNDNNTSNDNNDDDTSNNDDTSCGNGGYDRVGTDLRKYQKIFHLDVFG